jgi:pyruvate-ferredoxin/flavodoxin oxidoreductase
MTALAEAFNRGERETLPRTIGGRYGLSSKEFGPECVLAIFNELREARPKPRFTVGIYDDVTNLCRSGEHPAVRSQTGGAVLRPRQRWQRIGHKNNIKIIGNSTPVLAGLFCL